MVTLSGRRFIIILDEKQSKRRSNVILSKKSVIILRKMAWVYDTAAAANENDLVTDLADVWDEALQLNDGLLALSFLGQRGTDLPKNVTQC